MIIPRKILCINKITGYEHYQKDQNQKSVFESFDAYRKKMFLEHHAEHKRFYKNIIESLSSYDVTLTEISEDEIDSYTNQSFDLVISFGGDGTFLLTAQHFSTALLLGINSDVHSIPSKGSIGALTSIDKHSYKDCFSKLLSGNFVVEEWKCLYAKINDELLPEYAVNDIYFGAKESYATSHLEVFADGKIELFRGCSGILMTTGMGSTSWYKHAGGTPFTNKLPVFGFLIRDPNVDRLSNFTKGIIDESKELVIKPLRSSYVVSFDSKETKYSLQETDVLKIGLSDKHKVKVVRFQ